MFPSNSFGPELNSLQPQSLRCDVLHLKIRKVTRVSKYCSVSSDWSHCTGTTEGCEKERLKRQVFRCFLRTQWRHCRLIARRLLDLLISLNLFSPTALSYLKIRMGVDMTTQLATGCSMYPIIISSLQNIGVDFVFRCYRPLKPATQFRGAFCSQWPTQDGRHSIKITTLTFSRQQNLEGSSNIGWTHMPKSGGGPDSRTMDWMKIDT